MIRKTAAALSAVAALSGVLAGLGTSQAEAKPQPATPVSAADLPKTTDLRFEKLVFRVEGTVKGTDAPTISGCQSFTWGKLKPNAQFTRTYSAGTNAYGAASIASFATHAQAVAAADKLAKGFTDCGARMVKANPDLLTNYSQYNAVVSLPTGPRASMVTLNLTDGETGYRWTASTGVVATGTHVEVVALSKGDVRTSYDTSWMRTTLANTVKTLV